MISVIIPVYNAEKYLCQCLDSVCNQTYHDFEVIAVNDGSQDSSEQILKKYAESDSRFHVITHENQGISAARNLGIDASSGEWLAFVDSDDWLEPETLELAMDTAQHDGTDIVMWSYIREYPTGSKPLRVFGESPAVYRKERLLYPYRRIIGPVGEELAEPQKLNSGVTVWGKLYKRDVIASARMEDTKKIGSEDTLFNIQVFSQARLVSYLPNCLYHYRKENSQSFTHQNHEKILAQFSELYRRIDDSITGKDPELKEALQNRICLGLIGLGMRFVRHKGDGFPAKYKALRDALNLPEYRAALHALTFRYFPIHWKAFFFCAKHRWGLSFYTMLKLMDRMRKLG